MKHWPELTAVGVVVGLAVGSIASAGPVEVWTPCPPVTCPVPCSAEDCQAAADDQCEKYVAPGYVAFSACQPGAK